MNWLSDFDLHLYTDSAGNSQLGCGVYLQGQLSYFHWPYDWKDTDIITNITFEELVPIFLAVMLFKSLFHNKKIMFHIFSMIDNTSFKARHISIYNNSIADSISHKQWTRFRSLAPKADIHPLEISRG